MDPYSFRGYRGKNKQFSSSMSSLEKAMSSFYEKESEKQKEDAIKAGKQKLINDGIQNGQLNKDGTEKKSKGFFGDIPGMLADTGMNIAAGTEQGAAKVGDVYAKYLATVGTLADDINPILSQEERDKRLVKRVDTTEKIRDTIKSGKDVKGENFTGSKDIGLNDIKNDPRKLAELAAEGLDVGLSVTSLINPTSGAIKGASAQAGKTLLNQGVKKGITSATQGLTKKQFAGALAKESALFGGAEGTHAGLQAYGEGGNLGDTAKAAGIGVLSGAGGQAVLGVGGKVLGDAIGNVRSGVKKIKEAKNPEEADAAVNEVVQANIDKQNKPAGLLGTGQTHRDPTDIGDNIKSLQNGEDTSVFDYVDNAGNDVTSQVADFDKQIQARKAAIRDLQGQADGIDNNTGKSVPNMVERDPNNIYKDELSTKDGRRSPQMTVEEFTQSRKRGESLLNEIKSKKQDAAAIKSPNKWNSVRKSAYDASRNEWDGATIDINTGKLRPKGEDNYTLSIRDKGMDTVSVSPKATRAEFNKAMDEAKKKYAHILDGDGVHLGVFNDADTGMIEFDPVIVRDSLKDAQDIGAHTKAVGGAYHGKSGDGFWPGHVIDESNPAEAVGDVMGRANAADAVTRLEAEIQELAAQQSKAFDSLGGVTKTINTDRAKTRFAELQDELRTSTEYRDNVANATNREAAQAIDVNALNKEEADLKAGIVPDEMLKPFSLAKSVDDVQAMMRDADPQDSMGFIKGGQEIKKERAYIEDEMSKLFTPPKRDAEANKINKAYNDAKAEIETLPGPIQEKRMAEINDQVLQQYDDLDARVAQDAERVADLQGQMADQDLLENAMIQRAQEIQGSNPALYRPVDNAAVNKRLEEIKYQKFLAGEADANDAAKILEDTVQEGKTIAEEAKVSPAVSKAVDIQATNDIPSIRENTGKKAGLRWFIGTPTKAMRKFGPAGNQMADAVDNGVDLKSRLDGEFQWNMIQWGKIVKGKDTGENVAKVLDGDIDAAKALMPDSSDPLKDIANLAETYRNTSKLKTGVERAAAERLHESLNPQLRAAVEIKAWFEKRADELGIPKEGQIKDYLPHIFNGKDLDSAEQTLAYLRAGKKDGKTLTNAEILDLENSLEGIDNRTQAYLASKNNYIAKNGFLEKRKGAKDYTLDLERIMTAYNQAATTKIAYEPVVKLSNDISGSMFDEQNRFIKAVVDGLQGRTDTFIEKGIDSALSNVAGMFGKTTSDGTFGRASSKARTMIYNATIGANIGSAIRNTQQSVNIYTRYGANAMFEAAPRALAALKKDSPFRQELYRNGVLENRLGTYMEQGAMDNLKNKSTKVLWGMFNTTETLNRATAYFAGKDKYLKKFPNDIEGAERAGAKAAADTNFKFDSSKISPAMQSDFIKNVAQMQTYNVQQAGFIKDVFMGIDAGSKSEHAAQILRFLGGNALFFGTIGTATGMDWKEAVPFLSDTQNSQVPRSPMTQILFGDGKGNPGLVGSVKSGASALFTGKWEDAGKAIDATARGAVRTLVPGGNQAVKSIEGISSAVSGLSTTGSGITDTLGKLVNPGNPSGNVRFTQSDDAWSKFKASVLGQYSTQAGRDWVDAGMKNVPTNLKIDGISASEYIKSLPRESQEQYVGYYSTKQATTDQLKNTIGTKTVNSQSIVNGLKDGSLSEDDAVKRANDYNQQVIQAMLPYLQGNKKIPSRLMNDLNKNMLIDVQSAINSSKRTQSLESLQQSLDFATDDMENY